MASVRALAPVKLGGKWHPPGSILHGIGEVQVRAWGARVEAFDEERPAPPPGSPETAAKPLGLPTGPVAPAPAPGPPIEAEDDGNRVEQTALAIDLLDPPDFDAEGRPNIDPLSAILGFEPSAAELDLALAMRAEEGL